jgi:hypothetical protein
MKESITVRWLGRLEVQRRGAIMRAYDSLKVEMRYCRTILGRVAVAFDKLRPTGGKA